jgi:hypothetical protein
MKWIQNPAENPMKASSKCIGILSLRFGLVMNPDKVIDPIGSNYVGHRNREMVLWPFTGLFSP